MYPEDRIYAILPIEKITLYITEDTTKGKYSIDKKFLIWDKEWNQETLQNMRNDPDIKVLTHSEAIAEMKKENWKKGSE
jgi:hypothetical protein